MAAETAFIDALAAYLQARPALVGAQVGAAEPVVVANLPAVVLWLPEVHRLGAGLGEGAALVTGALPVLARVDLSNPVLPEEPAFPLLSEDRRTLILSHGGWVKADGTTGAMAAADLQVSVAGEARTVVDAAPAADQVQPNPQVGTLLFGAALPPAGLVLASYFVGQWERRMTPIAGALRIDVRASSAAEVLALSQGVLDALDVSAGAVLPRGLRKAVLGAVSAVGAPAPLLAGARGRELSFAFEYEHEVNQPDSSGGVIGRITLRSRLLTTVVEPASGAVTTSLTTETSEVPT